MDINVVVHSIRSSAGYACMCFQNWLLLLTNGECWTCILGEMWCILYTFLACCEGTIFPPIRNQVHNIFMWIYMWMSWDSMSKDECLMHYIVQMKTEAFSQNIGKVSPISKLVSRNSPCSFITANSDHNNLGWRLRGLYHLFKLSHSHVTLYECSKWRQRNLSYTTSWTVCYCAGSA